MFFEIICPDSIAICKSDNGYYIKSLKNFDIGDIIFSNESILFNVSETPIVTVAVNSTIFDLDMLMHTVNRDNNIREFYGFDTFTNHHCDPNTAVILHDQTHYDVVAIKKINKGDELFQDYDTFDSKLDKTTFMCNCGFTKCKKIIYG